MRNIQHEINNLQDVTKRVFIEIKKVDIKFDKFLKKTKMMLEQVQTGQESNMETLKNMANELITIYGEFEVLLLIQKFLKVTVAFAEKIKKVVLNSMLRSDKIKISPNEIEKVFFLFDPMEDSLDNYKIVSTITECLLNLPSKSYFAINLKNFADYDEIKALDRKALVFVFMNDGKHNMRMINNITFKIQKRAPKANCVVVSSYKSFDLEFGDHLQNELAININSITSRCVLINTRPFKFRKKSRLINVIHDILNF